jgi:hypothetical protein
MSVSVMPQRDANNAGLGVMHDPDAGAFLSASLGLDQHIDAGPLGIRD